MDTLVIVIKGNYFYFYIIILLSSLCIILLVLLLCTLCTYYDYEDDDIVGRSLLSDLALDTLGGVGGVGWSIPCESGRECVELSDKLWLDSSIFTFTILAK